MYRKVKCRLKKYVLTGFYLVISYCIELWISTKPFNYHCQLTLTLPFFVPNQNYPLRFRSTMNPLSSYILPPPFSQPTWRSPKPTNSKRLQANLKSKTLLRFSSTVVTTYIPTS